MILAVDKILSNLLVTEADRRRVRLKIERGQVNDEPSVADVVAEIRAHRDRLTTA